LVALDTCQWFTVTCDQTRYIAIDHGVDTDSIVDVKYGADDRLLKPLKFGVVGRVYETGRKGEHLAAALRKDGYNVVSWGKGWPVPEMFPGSRWETLPDFYREIDYLIVTSLNEGGPVPVIDAIAAGVPVIAPDVGWCWSYPVIPYEVGDLDSLRHVLSKLSNPPTWQGWIDDHIELFRRVRES
jgi:glycosyltransferase involved in cell wall biosynthesis